MADVELFISSWWCDQFSVATMLEVTEHNEPAAVGLVKHAFVQPFSLGRVGPIEMVRMASAFEVLTTRDMS